PYRSRRHAQSGAPAAAPRWPERRPPQPQTSQPAPRRLPGPALDDPLPASPPAAGSGTARTPAPPAHPADGHPPACPDAVRTSLQFDRRHRDDSTRRRRAEVASWDSPALNARPSRLPPARQLRVRHDGRARAPPEAGLLQVNRGGDLLSQEAPPQVPSAQAGLTAVFDMGTGVSPPPWPPEIYEKYDAP